MSVLFTFLNALTKILDKSDPSKEFLLDYLWRSTVLGGNGRVARAEGSWSHCVCCLEVEREEFRWLPPISLLL